MANWLRAVLPQQKVLSDVTTKVIPYSLNVTKKFKNQNLETSAGKFGKGNDKRHDFNRNCMCVKFSSC